MSSYPYAYPRRVWDPSAKVFSWEVDAPHNPYMQAYTTLCATDGTPIYEGDIISFTIKGITHGPEREDVAAAHVWWCAEDGCWAFGRWTADSLRTDPQTGVVYLKPWDHWYTMQDRIDRNTIKVLGNLWEHPELADQLGYDPFAT